MKNCRRNRSQWRNAGLALAGLAIALVGPVRADTDENPSARPHQFTFSWSFAAEDLMRPRGGTSTGESVRLDDQPTQQWQALQEPGLSSFERDRRAILAMAGGYRTSFDFLETVVYKPGTAPDRPYQSWGTEYVYVAEDTGSFISLQHLLVMVFVDAEGVASEPVVVKHWRQDWRYEDTELNVYNGASEWVHQSISDAAAAGSWTQAVFQVEDAPRYESFGRWVHSASFSSWESQPTWRPLPRREYSVRDDYDVLEAINRHTILPTGWVHEEDNLKLDLDDAGQPAANLPYLARELGVNRYERTAGFDFSAGHQYWENTGAFWAQVRAAWGRVFAANDRFRLADRVEGRPLYERLFELAEQINAEQADVETSRAQIDDVIAAYVVGL